MRLAAHGVVLDLPPGWEAAIRRDRKSGARPVTHLATVALPPDPGDFGSGVVEDLGPNDAFVAVLEYDPECAGTALFARQGIPRRLRVRAFNRRALQRTLTGQAGQQVFFTDGGRAFCLYVVLGRDHDIGPLVDQVHAVLDGVRLV